MICLPKKILPRKTPRSHFQFPTRLYTVIFFPAKFPFLPFYSLLYYFILLFYFIGKDREVFLGGFFFLEGRWNLPFSRTLWAFTENLKEQNEETLLTSFCLYCRWLVLLPVSASVNVAKVLESKRPDSSGNYHIAANDCREDENKQENGISLSNIHSDWQFFSPHLHCPID